MPNARVMLAFILAAAAITFFVYIVIRLFGQYQARIEEARLEKWDKDQEKRVKKESEKILHPKSK